MARRESRVRRTGRRVRGVVDIVSRKARSAREGMKKGVRSGLNSEVVQDARAGLQGSNASDLFGFNQLKKMGGWMGDTARGWGVRSRRNARRLARDPEAKMIAMDKYAGRRGMDAAKNFGKWIGAADMKGSGIRGLASGARGLGTVGAMAVGVAAMDFFNPFSLGWND